MLSAHCFKNPNKQSTSFYSQIINTSVTRMINTFTPIIQSITSDGAAQLHVAAYCDRHFSSMARIRDQVDRLLISMGLDDSDVQRIIVDTFSTYTEYTYALHVRACV